MALQVQVAGQTQFVRVCCGGEGGGGEGGRGGDGQARIAETRGSRMFQFRVEMDQAHHEIYARLFVPPVHADLGHEMSNDTSSDTSKDTDLGQDTSKETDLGHDTPEDTSKDTSNGPPSQARVLAFDHVHFSVGPFAPWLGPQPGRAADVTAPSRGGVEGGGGRHRQRRAHTKKKKKTKKGAHSVKQTVTVVYTTVSPNALFLIYQVRMWRRMSLEPGVRIYIYIYK